MGTALLKAFQAQHISIKSVFNRTEKKAVNHAKSFGIRVCGTFPSSLDQLGDVIFLTVSDRAIPEVASRLAELDGRFKGRTFVHCSGNESADLLQILRSKGASVASLHPLQTFTVRSEPGDFKNIYFSIQGDSQAFPELTKIAGTLGANTIEVTEDQKSHLHAAAVLVSNYLTTLVGDAVAIGAQGGLSDDQVKEALLPLTKTALQNIEEQSFQEALTGPIKRGDLTTVEKHLSLLDEKPELQNLYCVLGLQTLSLAESSVQLNRTTIEKMRKILSEKFTL